MIEVIPPQVNVSSSGSLHAMGAITINVITTYRSPPTSSGIPVMLFFLLEERRAAIPGMSESLRKKYCLSHSPAARWLQ